MALKKILLAYNGAVHSEQDMQWGLNFVRKSPVSTVIVKVIEPQNFAGRNNRCSDRPGLQEAENSRKNLLEVAVNALDDRELSATTTVLAGDPTAELIQFAEREQVDLIICGSNGLAELSSDPPGAPGGSDFDRRKAGQYMVYSLRAVAGK